MEEFAKTVGTDILGILNNLLNKQELQDLLYIEVLRNQTGEKQ